jgi:hypothetical protein
MTRKLHSSCQFDKLDLPFSGEKTATTQEKTKSKVKREEEKKHTQR